MMNKPKYCAPALALALWLALAFTAGATPLRVIVFPGTSNLPLWVASEKGWFEAAGIQLDLTFTRSSKQQMFGLLEGKYDIGHTAVDNVIAYNQDQGGDIKIYYGVGGVVIAFYVTPNIKGFADLKGKDLAVDALTTGFAFVLQKILHENGVGPGQYTLVSVGGTKQRFGAMKAGKTNGTLLTPPFIGLAAKAGFRNMGMITQYIPDYVTSVGVARSSWAAKNRALLVRYLTVMRKATAWVLDKQNSQAAAEIVARNLKIPVKIAQGSIASTLKHPQLGLYKDMKLPVKGIGTVLGLRKEMGYLKGPMPDPETLYDLGPYGDS